MKKAIFLNGGDLEEIREKKSVLLDKSLLIKTILDDEKPIKIITRPSRFGKSFNMGILNDFFNISYKDKDKIFHSLKIWNAHGKDNSLCRVHQGRYPVIHLSFMYLIRTDTIENFKNNLRYLISEEYIKYESIFKEREKSHSWIPKDYKKNLERNSNDDTLYQSLKDLSKFLSLESKQKVMVLIDEFDFPIYEFLSSEYHDEIIKSLGKILAPLIKDNPYVYQSIFTGVVPFSISKIFPDSNDYSIHTMLLDDKYGQYFGVTEHELRELFPEMNESGMNNLNNCFGGYKVGEHELYHPGFIARYYSSKNHGEGGLQYIYTTDAAFEIFDCKDPNFLKMFYSDFEALLEKKSIRKNVSKEIMSHEVNKQPWAIWSLLIHVGILSVKNSKKITDFEFDCELMIAN